MLDIKTDCGFYTAGGKEIPYIEAAAVYNEAEKELVVFAVNRSQEESCGLNIASDLDVTLVRHITVTGDDLKTVNSPNEEKIFEKSVSVENAPVLPKQSWNVLRYRRNDI